MGVKVMNNLQYQEETCLNEVNCNSSEEPIKHEFLSLGELDLSRAKLIRDRFAPDNELRKVASKLVSLISVSVMGHQTITSLISNIMAALEFGDFSEKRLRQFICLFQDELPIPVIRAALSALKMRANFKFVSRPPDYIGNLFETEQTALRALVGTCWDAAVFLMAADSRDSSSKRVERTMANACIHATKAGYTEPRDIADIIANYLKSDSISCSELKTFVSEYDTFLHSKVRTALDLVQLDSSKRV